MSDPGQRRLDVLPNRTDSCAFPEVSEPQVSSFGAAHGDRRAIMKAMVQRRQQIRRDSSQAFSQPPGCNHGVYSGGNPCTSFKNGQGLTPEFRGGCSSEGPGGTPIKPSGSISLPPPTPGRCAFISNEKQQHSEPASRTHSPKIVGRSSALESKRLHGAEITLTPSVDIFGEAVPCCRFAEHPVFCCRSDAAMIMEGLPRHVVRLERRPGAEFMGFGNVAAGPCKAPVLIITWIREGVLAAWNEKMDESLQVPLQSAIVAVNDISGNVQRMREQLREQVVEMQVITPRQW